MKSSIRKSTYKAVYRLLDRVSPLSCDCGTLCGAICCTCGQDREQDPDEPELGIYLLPGEEKLFTQREDWLHWHYERAETFDFPLSWTGTVYFVKCKNPPSCPRRLRPIQCRTFPLSPHLTADGNLRLVMCTFQVPYTCPIIEDNMDLTPAFVQATYTAWKRLIRDPLIFDLVLMDSRDREEDGVPLTFVR